MQIQQILHNSDFILTEAAVVEALRRSADIELHPQLANALLVYDEQGQKALKQLYDMFIAIAQKADVPMLLFAPTWRANQERLATAQITKDVNGDAVRFVQEVRQQSPWRERILVGGMLGCKRDCYRPEEALSTTEARDFHTWQIDRLVKGGADFLLAVTLPALSEAIGIAQAMAAYDIPYIISFVIGRDGRVLDGNTLAHAFQTIDEQCERVPLGYMINCAYPSFLKPHEQPEAIWSRFLGLQANASSLTHAELDGAATLQMDDVADWGTRMVELHHRFGVKILGGCCGTNSNHLEYIVQQLQG